MKPKKTNLKKFRKSFKPKELMGKDTIDVWGKCANCGVEYHIHKNN